MLALNNDSVVKKIQDKFFHKDVISNLNKQLLVKNNLQNCDMSKKQEIVTTLINSMKKVYRSINVNEINNNNFESIQNQFFKLSLKEAHTQINKNSKPVLPNNDSASQLKFERDFNSVPNNGNKMMDRPISVNNAPTKSLNNNFLYPQGHNINTTTKLDKTIDNLFKPIVDNIDDNYKFNQYQIGKGGDELNSHMESLMSQRQNETQLPKRPVTPDFLKPIKTNNRPDESNNNSKQSNPNNTMPKPKTMKGGKPNFSSEIPEDDKDNFLTANNDETDLYNINNIDASLGVSEITEDTRTFEQRLKSLESDRSNVYKHAENGKVTFDEPIDMIPEYQPKSIEEIKQEQYKQEQLKIQEQMKIQEQIKLQEQMKLQEQRKLQEQMKLQEQRKLQEQLKMREQMKLQEQRKLQEQTKLQEQMKLHEQMKLYELHQLKEQQKITEQQNMIKQKKKILEDMIKEKEQKLKEKIQKKQLSNQLKSNNINNNVDAEKIRETINKISNNQITLPQKKNNLESEISFKEINLSSKELELNSKELEILNNSVSLNNKENELNTKENELNIKETELNTKENELNIKETELNTKENELNEKETKLNEKETELDEKENELNEKETELNEKEAELISLYKKYNNRSLTNNIQLDISPEIPASEFVFKFNKNIENISNIKLRSCSIPQPRYNIEENKNNTFTYKMNNDITTITLPNGKYKIEELITVLNNNTKSLVFNLNYEQKIEVKSDDNFNIISTFLSKEVLGFTTECSDMNIFIANKLWDLRIEDKIYLFINNVNNNIPFALLNYNDIPNAIFNFNEPVTLDKLELNFKDSKGRLINFYGLRYSLNIELILAIN